MMILSFTTSVFAVAPPKVETLPDGYLIIGQYMIYRTQLTQENFDGAQLTTSDVQKMYYKSEFANGNWFNIDESQELVEILMSGGGQTVDSAYLNTFKYSVQIDEEGNIIYFTEGENAMPIEEVIGALEAEKTKLESQLDSLTGGEGEALAEDASDVEVKIDALNKSIGRDNSAAEEKKMLQELLAVAEETGNKDLIEALQSDLVALSPKLTDSQALLNKLTDLIKEKESLLAAIDQAKRNGFDDLVEALEQELASKDALIEDAMRDAQIANNANPTEAVESVLNEAIAKSNALMVAGEEVLPDDLASALEQYIEILGNLLDKSFKKSILLAGGQVIDASGQPVNLGELFKDLLEDKGIQVNQAVLQALVEVFANETIETLDPLLTVDVLTNNQAFAGQELGKLLGVVDDEVFKHTKDLVVLNDQLLAFLTGSDLDADIDKLISLLDEFGLVSGDRGVTDGADDIGQSDDAGESGESGESGHAGETDLVGDLLLSPEETAQIIGALSQLTDNTETLTDLLKSVSQLQAGLAGGQVEADSLLQAIEGMLLVAEEMGDSVLIEDLEALRDQLLLLQGTVHKNYYQDYMSYKKDRYFLLKDYSGNKVEAHDTAFESYTETIKVYDKGIYFIESNQLIDLEEATLEYEAFRLTYEGSVAERQRAQDAYEAYVRNKSDLLDQSLEVLSRQLESLYVKLGLVLENPGVSDGLKNKVRDLRSGIEDLVVQLIKTIQ